MEIKLLNDRLLVKAIPVEETTASGIILSKHLQNKNKGIVEQIGPNVIAVKKGDIIQKFVGAIPNIIEFNNQEYWILKESTDIDLILNG